MLNKDKDYHSYSSISSFIKDGPKSLIEKKENKGKGLSKGKLLDNYMYDTFDEKYYVSQVDTKLTLMENTFLDHIRNELEGMLSEDVLESKEFYDVCNDIVEQQNLFITERKKSNSESLILERIENVKHHLIDDVRAGNLPKVLPEDYIDIVNIGNKLKSNEFTSIFFNNKKIEEHQNLNQITILFEFENIKFKVIIDTIHVNHLRKTIQSVDLKYNSRDLKMFTKNYYDYNYGIQGCLYTLALREYIRLNPEFEKYNILEPSFIVVNEKEEPIIYRIRALDLYYIYYGYNDRYDKYKKGIVDYVNEIEYHKKENKYEYSMDYYNNEYITIDTSYVDRGDGGFRFIKSLNYNKNKKSINRPTALEDFTNTLNNSYNKYSISDPVSKNPLKKSTLDNSYDNIDRFVKDIVKQNNCSVPDAINYFDFIRSNKDYLDFEDWKNIREESFKKVFDKKLEEIDMSVPTPKKIKFDYKKEEKIVETIIKDDYTWETLTKDNSKNEEL